jgi:hypothetical protein
MDAGICFTYSRPNWNPKGDEDCFPYSSPNWSPNVYEKKRKAMNQYNFGKSYNAVTKQCGPLYQLYYL